jgi:hypothetical protein
MFIAIVQHTPGWVWALLAAMVALGLWQTRARKMSPMRATILPLVLIALSLSGVLRAFGHLPIALGGWAVGVGTTLAFARSASTVRGASWSNRTGQLHVPGSWLPLMLIVGLFSIKYFAGASLAMNPGLATDATFAGLCSLGYGSFSGVFAARALALRGLANPRHALHAA